MKTRIYLFILALTLFISTAHAQSVYYFQYKFPQSSNSNVYNAFFVRYADGFGFMRIRFDEPVSGQLVVAEMQLWQREFQLSNGDMDTSRIRFDTTGTPKYIFGSSKTKFPIPGIGFKLNKANNTFETGDITARDSLGMEQTAKILSKAIYNSENIDKDIVSEFYTPGEDFFVNLTEPGLRGFNLSPVEQKIKMHLLIVSNTNDPIIGKGCAFDIRNTILTFDSIRKFMGIGMLTTVISGKNYNKTNVEKAIKALNPDPNDIVIFYYTGHGFRKKEDTRIFPYIDLRPKDDKTYNVNSLNIQDVFNTIRNKPKAARLNLVISDCCNTLPGAAKANGKSIGGFRDIRDWSVENCRKLFLDPTPVSVLMTAAEVDQVAACDTTVGSLFTIFFKAALENNLTKYKKNVNWDQVLQQAKNALSFKARHTYCARPFIPENICKQDPIPKLIVGRGN